MVKNALEEALIQSYHDNQRYIQVAQSVLMVNAVLAGARQIGAAIVGDSTSNSQSINKELQSLKEIIFPEFKEHTQKSADKAKAIMEKVDKLGPIQVAAIGGAKGGGRVKRGNR